MLPLVISLSIFAVWPPYNYGTIPRQLYPRDAIRSTFLSAHDYILGDTHLFVHPPSVFLSLPIPPSIPSIPFILPILPPQHTPTLASPSADLRLARLLSPAVRPHSSFRVVCIQHIMSLSFTCMLASRLYPLSKHNMIE